MFLTFVLASALAMSTVIGLPPSAQMTYVTEDKILMQSDETPQVMVVGDRSSDLKFVMAIQSSTIWEKIEERWLTINKSQGLDKAIGKKSPDSLSDQELAQLKQACHDGLKCVAVDQLLVLGEVNKPLGDGKVSVRTAIIKITQVLTQYTTEYHKDVYQYEEVKQSDDQSKVNESVTIILEDNKELCQINLKPSTQKNIPPKNADGNTIPTAGNNNNNNNAVNTFKNYNIINGTVNNAIVNIEPHSGDSGDSNGSKHKTPPVDSNAAIAYGPTEIEPSGIITVVELSEPGTQAINGSDPSLVIVIEPQTKTTDGDRSTKKRSVDDLPPTKPYPTTGDKSVVKDRKNDALQKQTRQNQKRDRGTSNLHYYELPTTKNADGNTVPTAGNNNDNAVNSNTIENYNINNGTVNNAFINIEPHSGDSGDSDVSKLYMPPSDRNAATAYGLTGVESKNRSPYNPVVNADRQSMAPTTVYSTPGATDGPTGDESITKTFKNDTRQIRAMGGWTSDRPVTATEDHLEYAPQTIDKRHKYISQPIEIIHRPSAPRQGYVFGNGSAADIGTDNGGRGLKSRLSRPDVTGRTHSANAVEPATNNKTLSRRSNGNDANTVNLDNSTCGRGGGENVRDCDIISKGSLNELRTTKDLVDDGYLNNGIMNVKSVDDSNRNKGIIKDAKATGGIINIGTTNNGPVNYGTSKAYTSGTTTDTDSYDISRYVDNIDKMYSIILNKLAMK